MYQEISRMARRAVEKYDSPYDNVSFEVRVDLRNHTVSYYAGSTDQLMRPLGRPLRDTSPPDFPTFVTMNSSTSTTPELSVNMRQRGDREELPDTIEMGSPVIGRAMRVVTERDGDPVSAVAMIIELAKDVGMGIYDIVDQHDESDPVNRVIRAHELLSEGVPVPWVLSLFDGSEGQ